MLSDSSQGTYYQCIRVANLFYICFIVCSFFLFGYSLPNYARNCFPQRGSLAIYFEAMFTPIYRHVVPEKANILHNSRNLPTNWEGMIETIEICVLWNNFLRNAEFEKLGLEIRPKVVSLKSQGPSLKTQGPQDIWEHTTEYSPRGQHWSPAFGL